MTPRLLVYNQHADRFRRALAAGFPGVAILAATTRAEALAHAPGAQVLVALDSRFEDALVSAAPDLVWIQALSTGTDVIDRLKTLDRRRVMVTTTRGIHGPQMSEITLMHMLALSRRLPKMLRNQQDRRWERWEQPLLWRKTVAILGVGAIAGDMARCFSAFGMTVLGISRTEREVEHFERIYPRSRMKEAVALADYLVVLAPHSKENDRLVGAGVLAAMKPGAYLVNVSRGGVVDEPALVDAEQRAQRCTELPMTRRALADVRGPFRRRGADDALAEAFGVIIPARSRHGVLDHQPSCLYMQFCPDISPRRDFGPLFSTS